MTLTFKQDEDLFASSPMNLGSPKAQVSCDYPELKIVSTISRPDSRCVNKSLDFGSTKCDDLHLSKPSLDRSYASLAVKSGTCKA